MKRSFSISRSALQQTIFYTVLFSLLAHGYRFLNMSFSGDAAQISQAEEVAYQISIGRYFQPVLWMIRGHITAPLTIGLFATAALAASAVLIVSMLGLTSRLPIMLICGILATNETLGVSYATYLPWVDVYMIAFFFATAGVYVSMRYRYGWLLSPFFYLVTLALYQSYLQAASTLTIMLLILSLLRGEKVSLIWQTGIKACLSLLAGLLLYAAGLKLVLALLHLSASNDYNGVTRVGSIAFSEIPKLISSTFLYPLQFYTRSADHAFISPLLTAALLLLSLPALLVPARRLSLCGKLTLLFLIVMLPLGANFVAFISQGIVHPLMVYAFFFLYVLCIALLDYDSLQHSASMFSQCTGHLAAAILFLMVGCNILTSNQLYLRRDLEFYSTTSAATRILKHADQIEGYVPGETPVCVLGYLPSSKISFVRPGFESLSNLQGMRYTYAAAYETSTTWYFQMILGYPVNFVSADEQRAYQESGIGNRLTLFPDKGCYQIIDGILFIRIN